MKLFDNPFYILGASPSDTRKRLNNLYEDRSLLDPSEKYADAFQTLTHPAKRLQAELCWLPGCDRGEADLVLERILAAVKRGSCSFNDVIKTGSSVQSLVQLNELYALLPEIGGGDMEQAIFCASRLFDDLCSGEMSSALLEVINADRAGAGFPAVQSLQVLEDELSQHLEDISAAFSERISRLPPGEYAVLIERIAAFGVSPIISRVIRDYKAGISVELEELEDAIERDAETLERSSIKEQHHDCIDRIRSAVSRLNVLTEPLLAYGRSIGSDEITDDIREFFFRLFDCASELAKQLAFREAMDLYRIAKSGFPNTERYASFLKSIDNALAYLNEQLEDAHRRETEQYKRLAEEAWAEEQRKNDEMTRSRAKEAERLEKERVAARMKAERAKREETARLKAEQAKKEESARLEAERVKKEREKLIQKRQRLLESRKALGFFEKKERKNIDRAISEIDRKLDDMDDM